MAVYRLTLSYRGGAYAGWQRQPNALTVQQVLEEALEKLLGTGIRVIGASRTDAGVHARGQAAHLALAEPFPERGLVHGGNRHLPPDIRILAADRMCEGFHARRHAHSKEYCYRLVRTRILSPLESLFAVAVSPELDLGAMSEATASLTGRHDFSAFALAGGAHRQPFRTLFRAEWESTGDDLVLVLEGNGFLRGMVRSVVGTLIEVGRGRRTPEGFTRLLEGGKRASAGPTAPAQGLVLNRVAYSPEWEAHDSDPVEIEAIPSRGVC